MREYPQLWQGSSQKARQQLAQLRGDQQHRRLASGLALLGELAGASKQALGQAGFETRLAASYADRSLHQQLLQIGFEGDDADFAAARGQVVDDGPAQADADLFDQIGCGTVGFGRFADDLDNRTHVAQRHTLVKQTL